MPSTRSERIHAAGGGEFSAHVAIPDAGSGPGMLVIQEIFGITGYIKEVCDRLARLGYVALAPDLYWRLEPGVAIDEREPGALERAFGYMQRLDFMQACEDAVAALEHLQRLPEVKAGRAGVIGFCLGGGISYMVAANANPATCVSYYGSAVPDALSLADNVECPILFQFGLADSYLPPEKQALIRQAFAGRHDAEFGSHEGAGHAFDNHDAAMFHNERAAAAAWEQTKEFLARTLD